MDDDVWRVVMTLAVAAVFLIYRFSYNHKEKLYSHGKRQQIPTPSSFRIVYPAVMIATFLITFLSLWFPNPALLIVFNGPIARTTGLLILILGAALFVWAKRSLGINYSPCYDAFVPLNIVIHGPYKHVRHPMYLANSLVILGLFLSTGGSWLVVILVTLICYYVVSATTEERFLSAYFDDYRSYRMNTGMFLPPIHLKAYEAHCARRRFSSTVGRSHGGRCGHSGAATDRDRSPRRPS